MSRQFDVLVSLLTTTKGRRMLRALHAHAPEGTRLFESGKPRPGSTLILYGLGGIDRYTLGMNHVASGGTLVCWDVGYWHRKGDDTFRKMRVSINGLHPPAYVMRGPRPDCSRWDASGLRMEQRGDPDGPIVLVGNGPKSNGIGAKWWASEKSKELRRLFPGKRIVYRPKPKRPYDVAVDYDEVDAGPIDDLVGRASLVVCRHSNVAVDACRLGVPVVCDDGAASAIYPQRLDRKDKQPSTAVRQEFLHRLAWWQWSPAEAKDVWPWLNGVLDDMQGRSDAP